jgi:predicted Zn-dependent protease
VRAPIRSAIGLLSVAGLGVLLSVSVLAGQTPVTASNNKYTPAQDVELGRKAAVEVEQQLPILKDKDVTRLVTTIGARLVAAIPEDLRHPEFQYTFKVVNVSEINAFALPGGPMFIYTGLLKACDNEAQLAGVMGHEMSHVILRHGTNQASKANLIQLPAALAVQMAGKGSMMGQLAQLGIGLGANSVLLKFSRTAETQADLMGSHLMAEAGYDPMAMAQFFNKLGSLNNSPGKGFAGSVAQFMSDHPNPDNRERAIEQEAQFLPQSTYNYQTGDFKRMKQAVAKIHEPAPKQAEPSAQKQ